MTDPIHQPATALEAALAASASAESIADALRTSELRYRRLFEMARDGILILDSEQGRITDANPFMSELLGYPRADLIGKELWEIGLLQDKEANQAAFQQLKRDGYIRYEDLPLKNENQEQREVEFVSNLYRENGHTVIQCNIRDITERKRLDAQLAVAAARAERIAETLQLSMLQIIPSHTFAGLTIETLYKAALNEAEVGGDFFDAFALSGDKTALVVGDVSGKGLSAAGRTAEVKYALRAFLHEYLSPDIAISQLNQFIWETHRLDKDSEESFIILAVAVVDNVTGYVTFVSAGAEPFLILRSSGQVETVNVTGTPLGILSQAEYVGQTILLEAGDTVLTVTDGITEARRGTTFLGIEGLLKIFARCGPSATLGEIARTIYVSAQDFSESGVRDDVCILLGRRH
jgi:PAS domain S-box-containing protein